MIFSRCVSGSQVNVPLCGIISHDTRNVFRIFHTFSSKDVCN